MSTRYLLDTNICIYIIRHKPAEVRRRFEQLKTGEAAISAITFGELHYGAAKSQHPRAVQATLQELTSFLPVLPLPADAGLEYGLIRTALETKGKPIGGNDLWIAAHAKSAGLILITNNEREFKRVASLKVENWVERN
jgi:tRNA(fMet)-specific endonuclease VapC